MGHCDHDVVVVIACCEVGEIISDILILLVTSNNNEGTRIFCTTGDTFRDKMSLLISTFTITRQIDIPYTACGLARG